MKTDLTVAAYIVKDNKILLIDHKKLGRWLPPGGHIEINETPDQALKREIKEEVGIDIEFVQKKILHAGMTTIEELAVPFYANIHSVGDHNHYGMFYLCRPLSLELKLEKDKILGAKWFSASDLNEVSEDVRKIGLEALKISQ